MHWRPLNTLITKELQASGGLRGESGGVARVVWVVRVVGVVGAVWAVGGAGMHWRPLNTLITSKWWSGR